MNPLDVTHGVMRCLRAGDWGGLGAGAQHASGIKAYQCPSHSDVLPVLKPACVELCPLGREGFMIGGHIVPTRAMAKQLPLSQDVLCTRQSSVACFTFLSGTLRRLRLAMVDKYASLLHAKNKFIHAASPADAVAILAGSISLHCKATGARMLTVKVHRHGHWLLAAPCVPRRSHRRHIQCSRVSHHTYLGITISTDPDAAARTLYTYMLYIFCSALIGALHAGPVSGSASWAGHMWPSTLLDAMQTPWAAHIYRPST